MILNKLAVMKNKKGFTLIEIIVVLVIIAIMAAAAIPAMFQYVDQARGMALAAEARSGLIAAQALFTEVRAAGVANVDTVATTGAITNDSASGRTHLTRFGELLGTGIDAADFRVDFDAADGVVELIYDNGTRAIRLTPGGQAVQEATGAILTSLTP